MPTSDRILAELKTLRAKERLPQLRPANTAFDGQDTIPTFAEVLALSAETNIGVYCELKHPSYLRGIGKDPLPALIADVNAAGGQSVADKMFVLSNIPASPRLTLDVDVPRPRSASQHPRQRQMTTTQTTSMVETTPTMRPQRHPLSCRPRLPLRDRACLISSVREGRQPCPSSLPLSPVASSTTG